ncbi:MAG: hypothetical protein ACNA7W_16890 [Pseudomonadales bacterium]
MLPILVTTLALLAASCASLANDSRLAGRWIINQELTAEVQPEIRSGSSLLEKLPRPSISVGGMPLPGTSRQPPPPAAGSATDPKVLRAGELTIAPLDDAVQLHYAGHGSDTFVRGNQQGIISRWSDRKLTTRYETTSRKVSQTYEVRKDGRLLVTVKLDPNQGPAIVRKRVFDAAESP